jgi:hypothetical protein
MDSTAAQHELGVQPTPWLEVLADVIAHYRARSA